MLQTGLFDLQDRFNQLDSQDPLTKINQVVDWELFRGDLDKVRNSKRPSVAGRKPYNVILMFKILVVQSLYNLSDDQTEFQIRDRLTFMRFLNLSVNDRIPSAKTIWLFREQITQSGCITKVFKRFDDYLRQKGFSAKKGQIVDASIVAAPRQRNSREENKRINSNDIPEDWNKNKRRQKDTDARWIKKGNGTYYGYKNHIDIDVDNKLIRSYDVTPASTHDSNVFTGLLDNTNSSRDVWADAAYRKPERLAELAHDGYREHIQRKGCRHKKLAPREQAGNDTRSKVRCRVEHVFGHQHQRAGNLLIRTIGIIRAHAKIGLRNLTYNFDRYRFLVQSA